jgi:hypothetical protein
MSHIPNHSPTLETEAFIETSPRERQGDSEVQLRASNAQQQVLANTLKCDSL